MNTFVRLRKKVSFTPHKERVGLKKYLIIFFLLVIGGLLVFLLLKKTVRAPGNYITSIIYTNNSKTYVKDQRLYDYVTTIFHGKNYYSLRYLKQGENLHKVRQQYPLVSSIELTSFIAGQLTIRLHFDQPALRIQNTGHSWGMYGDYLHTIQSGDILGSGMDTLWLPDYLSGISHLSGMFFMIPPELLLEFYTTVNTHFGEHDYIEYLAGGEKLVVHDGMQEVYFSLLGDPVVQMKKYLTLKTYYTGFDSLKKIDLGSLVQTIVR